MDISFDGRAKKVLKSLSEEENGRILGYIDLFSKNGFNMTSQYLKKIDNNLWELRPGNIRLLFGLVRSDAIIVNIFKKKSQKTPIKEIKTSKKRLKEYQI